MIKKGIILALSVGLIDAHLGLPDSRNVFGLNTFLPIVTTSIFVFLIYMVSYYTLGLIFIRFINLKAEAVSVSLALLLGPALLLASLRLSIPGSLGLNSFQLIVPILIVLVGSIAVYFASQRILQNDVNRNRARVFAIVVPLVLMELLVMRLVMKAEQLGRSPLILAASLIILLTLGVLYRFRETKLPERSLYCFTAMIFAGFFLSLLLVREPKRKSVPEQHANQKIKQIVLITIDTLRADAVSAKNTPNIYRLAADGVLFENGFSESPWTLPAITSIMTGVSPLVHRAVQVDSQVPPELPTLAEFMSRAGFYTSAIGRNLNLVEKLSRGFVTYDFFPRTRIEGLGGFLLNTLLSQSGSTDASTSDLTRLAERWMNENSNKHFFFWLHYFDPHMPYAPPARFQPPEAAPRRIGKKFQNSFIQNIRLGFFVPDKNERLWIKELYLGEVRYVDEQIGQLMNTMKLKGVYDQSLIILTSDHGEEFWEHDSFAHAHTLYNELLRVPLVVKMPGSPFKGKITQSVATTALLPTILELCGIRFNPDLFSSGSFSKLLASAGSVPEEPVVGGGLLFYGDKVSVQYAGTKYVRDLITDREELFDLVVDPQEQIPVDTDSSEQLQAGRNLFEENLKSAARLQARHRISIPQKKKLDQETEEMLRSLGYIQ
ncbi:sulfatase-like hydrolase/transferase [bacterium]|nr:sulfatase-like hydrolase/transferase [bacterium]